MTFSNKITSVLLILIALAFTLLIHEIVPEQQFVPYRLELDSVWQKTAGDQEYVVDLSNDSEAEFVTHHHINQTGHSIEYRHKDELHTVHIFYKDDFFISKFLHFSDVNQDGKKEIIFITAIHEIAWLNIFAYYPDLDHYKPARKIEIGPVNYYNNNIYSLILVWKTVSSTHSHRDGHAAGAAYATPNETRHETHPCLWNPHSL